MTNKINIRSTFLPDDGCVMVRCDLSQIEDRMCKMYCGSPKTIELANRKPWNYDAHTENAKAIFKKDTITKQERYLGKKCVHASQRKMQGVRMSESVSKDTKGDLFIHPRICDRLIQTYLDSIPEIEKVYFPWVERQVQSVGVLETSWGRRLDLRHLRIDNNLYREAYSFYLQAEAADWTNQYLFIPMFHYMIGKYGKPVNGQIHDEVIVSVPLEDAYEAASVMVMSAQQTREVPKGSGNYLCVPADVTVARNYGDKDAVEFTKLPGKVEFYSKLKDF